MSTPLRQSVTSDPQPGLDGGYAGRLATTPSDMAEKVYVIIPALSTDQRIGPCRWQARDDVSLPARGDRCYVVFDDNQEAWVIAWWPFNS